VTEQCGVLHTDSKLSGTLQLYTDSKLSGMLQLYTDSKLSGMLQTDNAVQSTMMTAMLTMAKVHKLFKSNHLSYEICPQRTTLRNMIGRHGLD
jgi:hypothetical protein